MNNDPLLYEKIDLYLKNRLSEKEHYGFTQEIEKDHTLKELVDAHRIAHQLILTKQLINLQAKMQSDLSSSGKSQLFRLLLGIGLMVAVGSILYLVNKSETISSKPKETFTTATSIESGSIIPSSSRQEPKKQETNINTSSPSLIQRDTRIEKDTTHTIEENSTKSISSETNIISVTESPTSKEITTIDCSQMTIAQAISVSPTCVGEQNGKIVISPSGINGGKIPFHYSLNKKEKLSSENEFHYLNAGIYTVYVKDDNNCLAQKTIEVEEKACMNSRAFAFTPEYQKWTIPVSQNKQGILKIYNKSGILVYQSEVSSEKENLWDGTSNTGQTMGTGYYTFTIRYSDGEEEAGSVSIIHP